MKFQPDPAVADPESWTMYKLGHPVSPSNVMLNGSQSQHAVSREGVSISSQPDSKDQRELLTIG